MGTTHHTTRRKCTTDLEFSTNTLLTKLTLVDICHRWSPSIGWSPTAPRMVTHATRRKSTTYLEFSTYTLLTKLTLVDICHRWSPSIGWSPTATRMVTPQPKDGR